MTPVKNGNIEVRENDVRCTICGETLAFNWNKSDKVIGRLCVAFKKLHDHCAPTEETK